MQCLAPAEPKPSSSDAQPCITLTTRSHPAWVPSVPAPPQQRQLFSSRRCRWGIGRLPFSSCQQGLARRVPWLRAGYWFTQLVPYEVLLLDVHTPGEFCFPSCQQDSEQPPTLIRLFETSKAARELKEKWKKQQDGVVYAQGTEDRSGPKLYPWCKPQGISPIPSSPQGCGRWSTSGS